MLKKVLKLGIVFFMILSSSFTNINIVKAEEPTVTLTSVNYEFDGYKMTTTIEYEGTADSILVRFSCDTLAYMDFQLDHEFGYAGGSDIYNEVYEEPNKITFVVKWPSEYYYDSPTTYRIKDITFKSGKTEQKYTSDNELLSNKSIVVDASKSYYTNITAEDIEVVYDDSADYGGKKYVTFFKNQSTYKGIYEIKAREMKFEIIDINHNNHPAFDETLPTNELIEVTFTVIAPFAGGSKKFDIVVPAYIQDLNLKNKLKNIQVERDGKNITYMLDHEYLDKNIRITSAKFVDIENEENVKYITESYKPMDGILGEFKSTIMELEYWYGLEDKNYYLKTIEIECEGQKEEYILADFPEIKPVYLEFLAKDNPYLSVEEQNIKWNFLGEDQLLLIDRNTFEVLNFDFVEFIAEVDFWQSYKFKPIRVELNETNEDIFNVTVIVKPNSGINKEYRVENIPAKFYKEEIIDVHNGVSNIELSFDRNYLVMNITHDNHQDIGYVGAQFVNVENENDRRVWQNIKYTGSQSLLTEPVYLSADYYFDKPVTYRIEYLELGPKNHKQGHYEKYYDGDDLLKDKTFTLNPEDNPFIGENDQVLEAYFPNMADTIKIQKGTGKTDYSMLEIMRPYGLGDCGYIKSFEVMNNPGLDPNSNPNQEYKVDAYVTFKTRAGYERRFIVKNIAAKVIEPIGKISGRKTNYLEKNMKYTDYQNENMTEDFWFNPEPRKFIIELFAGGTKEILVEPTQYGGEFPWNVPYCDATRYFDVGLEYVYEGTEEDISYYDEFMNDIYFVDKKRIYLIDENKNLVDAYGVILAKYNNRSILNYDSNSEKVQLTSKEGSIPTYSEMEVEKVNDVADLENYVAYDMNLKAYGEEVQPVDEVEVGIEIPKYMEGNDLEVVYVDDQGKPTDETFDVTEKNDVAYFTTSHFSTYALVSKDKIQIDVPEVNHETDLKKLNVLVNNKPVEYDKGYRYSVKETPTGENKFDVTVTIQFIGGYQGLDDVVRTYSYIVKSEEEKAAEAFIHDCLTDANGVSFVEATKENYKQILASEKIWEELSDEAKSLVDETMGIPYEKLLAAAKELHKNLNENKVPDTGDTRNVTFPLIGLGVAAGVLVFLFKKKRNQK